VHKRLGVWGRGRKCSHIEIIFRNARFVGNENFKEYGVEIENVLILKSSGMLDLLEMKISKSMGSR
jgi:hypothetical protein